MRDLDAYIEELLYEHECVIVPGFGGFLTNAQEARIKDNTIIPPGRSLLFNRQLKNNDGLLAGYISKRESGDYSFAMRFINHFAENNNELLRQGKTVELKRLGKLNMGTDENLIFQPASDRNFDIKSYGLLPVNVQPVKAKVTAKAATVIKQKAQPKQLKAGNWKSYLAAACVLGILATSGFLLWRSGSFDEQLFKSTLNPFSIDTFQENTITEPAVAEGIIKDTIGEDVKVQVEQPVITENEGSVSEDFPDTLYHIIVGAFSIEANAVKTKKQLEQKGYRAEIIRLPGSQLLRVSAVSLSERTAAQIKVEEIKQTENPDSWILAHKK